MSDLLDSVGLDLETYEKVAGPAIAAAEAANAALSRARHNNQQLDELLTERDEQSRISMEKTYDRLMNRLGEGRDAARQLLKVRGGDGWTSWLVY